MRRRHRFAVATGVIAAGVALVALLTSLSTAAEGPLTTGMERVAAGFGSLEHRLSRYFRGPGRSAGLTWFARYRENTMLLRRPDAVLLGSYDSRVPNSLDGVLALEQRLGTTLPLVQIYTAWGDKPEQRFPLAIVTAIWDVGSVPVITWEPWLTDFESAKHPHLPLRDARESHGMASVARGDYDFYIDVWAAAAAKFGKPLYVRWGHEMNDPYRYSWGPQNNTKEEYIAAWRRVVDRFRVAGAHNVIWVWSPHVAYEYWDLYYPGDSHVDWVATGALNYGPIAQWSRWWTFAEIFGSKYSRLASFGKPVMVAEFGSLAVGGNRAEWYQSALTALPQQYPAVKALLFFDASSDQTVTYQKVDWRVGTDTAVAAAVARAIAPWSPARR